MITSFECSLRSARPPHGIATFPRFAPPVLDSAGTPADGDPE